MFIRYQGSYYARRCNGRTKTRAEWRISLLHGVNIYDYVRDNIIVLIILEEFLKEECKKLSFLFKIFMEFKNEEIIFRNDKGMIIIFFVK